MKTKILIILTIIISVNLSTTPLAQAHGFSLNTKLIPVACTDANTSTECGVDELVHTFIHIAEWIIAIIGAVALAMFIYGGFLWVTSAGQSSMVDKGRSILVGTTIGIIIVLVAFTLVKFVGNSLNVSNPNFDKYLDPSSKSNQSTNNNFCTGKPDGTRCFNKNQNVYACINETCSEQTLCDFWANQPVNIARLPGIGNVTPNHSCIDLNATSQPTCKSGSILPDLCGGGRSILCCIP